MRIIITPGQTGDITCAAAPTEGIEADAILGDKAYDSHALRETIAQMGADAVIPSNRSRKVAIPHDRAVYRNRNRVERCFNRLKHFRRLPTRYDRRTIHFRGFVLLAASNYGASGSITYT